MAPRDRETLPVRCETDRLLNRTKNRTRGEANLENRMKADFPFRERENERSRGSSETNEPPRVCRTHWAFVTRLFG